MSRQPIRLDDQDGMTLIEIMIGAFLTVVVVAAIVGGVSSMLASERSSNDTRKAQLAAADALDTIGDDIRNTLSSARIGATDPTDPTGVNRAATKEGLKEILTSGLPEHNKYMDVVVARPEEVVLRVDSLARAGDEIDRTECVRWHIRAAADGTRHMVRTVWTGDTVCPGASEATAVETRELFEVQPADPTKLQKTGFRYRLQTVTDVGERKCSVVADTDNTVTGTDLNRISAIAVLFTAKANGTGIEPSRDVYAIRGRQTADYLYAIGCAF